MSHTRVKTTFEQMGDFGKTDIVELFCHHNHSSDFTTFYYKGGEIVEMCFQDWSINGQDKWDAVQRLWFPFKEEWGKELKDGVEYYKESELRD